jgi:hypothetical protein
MGAFHTAAGVVKKCILEPVLFQAIFWLRIGTFPGLENSRSFEADLAASFWREIVAEKRGGFLVKNWRVLAGLKCDSESDQLFDKNQTVIRGQKAYRWQNAIQKRLGKPCKRARRLHAGVRRTGQILKSVVKSVRVQRSVFWPKRSLTLISVYN